MPLIRDKNCLLIFSWNDKRKTIKALVRGSLVRSDQRIPAKYHGGFARGTDAWRRTVVISFLLCLPGTLRLTSGNAMPQLHD